jgi:hypothetical protein
MSLIANGFGAERALHRLTASRPGSARRDAGLDAGLGVVELAPEPVARSREFGVLCAKMLGNRDIAAACPANQRA